MAVTRTLPPLIEEKLATFASIESLFEASFQFVQEVQGQRRFTAFPIAYTVGYLHALCVCDRKDHLLSVPRVGSRYEGERCLELLRDWQAGHSTGVVAFLQRKLDALPYVEVTRQLEAARRGSELGAVGLLLERGRLVLLRRGINLHLALEPIFTLREHDVIQQVRAACAYYGHTPEQIEEQLRELRGPAYAFVRHPALAQRNMVLMDRVGVRAARIKSSESDGSPAQDDDQPAREGAFAEQMIGGYVLLTAPGHNNPRGVRFVDRADLSHPMLRRGA
jgi:hypothetical protein